MLPTIHSKLPNIGTNIFTSMSALAVQHKAINLGQGFPDYDMNPQLIELVNKAMKDGYNQYTHSNGLPLLREVIAQKIKTLYHASIHATHEITITPGGTYAIYTALTAILQPGDEVIVYEPAYDCYIPAIELCGATAITIPLTPTHYNIDKAATRQSITKRTKAIIINSPHNPTGTVLAEADIEFLKEITANTNLFIISDEVYEHLTFDNKKHLSILKYPELYERAFVSFSLGKVYNCTGWKIGYCIAPPLYSAEFRKVHQFNVFTVNSAVQHALASFMQIESEYLAVGVQLQAKRDYLLSLMRHTKFEPITSHGSYFQMYSYKNISQLSEHDMAIKLVKEAGVATIPVSAFYSKPVNNQVLRFCFAKKESTLEAAVEKLINL